MKNILLHACCGPCSLMPTKALLEEGFNLTAYFYNPNIHLQDEYFLRLDSMRLAAKKHGIKLIVEEPLMQDLPLYTSICKEFTLSKTSLPKKKSLPEKSSLPESSLPKITAPKVILKGEIYLNAWIKELKGLYAEGERCKICYKRRMLQTAYFAKAHGFEGFSTSLLYSRYQSHENICQAAQEASEQADIAFLYRDFRPMWQAGIDLSKDWDLYRQKWCGCILSRAESLLRKRQKDRKKSQKKQN